MVHVSSVPPIDIPQVDLLTYLFPPAQPVSQDPIWLDSADPENCLSPKQMLNWAKRLMIGLDRLGVKEQEAVMILTPNHIFVPAAYLGIVGSRRVFTAANPIYTVTGEGALVGKQAMIADYSSEMGHQLKDTDAKVLLVHPSLLQTAISAARTSGLSSDRIFQFSDRPNVTTSDIPDWREFLGTVSEADSYRWRPMTSSESSSTIATVNYSSGTTGLPKGVCVSHQNLIANTEQTIAMKYLGTSYTRSTHPSERWVGFLPLYHAYGQLWCMVMAIKLNIPIYIMKAFSYEPFLRTIQTYKITHLQVAPPILVMLSKRPETSCYDISSVEHCLCGAAPLSKELQNEIRDRFGIPVIQGWGMTEVTCGGIHVPFSEYHDDGTVGILDPNMESKLLSDDGQEVPDGEPGELFVRGPNICIGYWRNEEATREALSADGWLKTGDVAVRNERGYYWIVDRKKELIKVNALQVAPAELEAALLGHEAVADAACVGVTVNDEEYPRGYVVLKSSHRHVSEQDLHAYMAVRVAKHKQLTGGIAFVEEVPKLASGKIVRKLIREWAKRDARDFERVRAKL